MRKLNQNQSGFGYVVLLLAIIVIAAISYTGWMVLKSEPETQPNSSANSASQYKPEESMPPLNQTTTPDQATTQTTEGYLVIKEWGVKIKTSDADKLTYTYDESSRGNMGEGNGIIDSTIKFVIKSEFFQDKTCTFSDGATRYSSQTDEFMIKLSQKIGDYFYVGGGSWYNCDIEADNTLKSTVRENLGKFEAL